MNATNCPRCGRVFVRSTKSICDSCVKEEEANFERVRAYVKEYPNRPIKEVSDECEVPVKRILQYVREGRIDASPGIAANITCSKCGKPVMKGNMCEKCAVNLNMQIVGMKKEPDNVAIKGNVKGKVFTSK